MMMDIISTTSEGYEIHFRKVEIIQLNKMAKIEYQLATPGNLESKILIIEGDDYQGWNNNDYYIADLILSKHNLVRKPKIQPATLPELYYIKNDDGTLTEKVRQVSNPDYDPNQTEGEIFKFNKAPIPAYVNVSNDEETNKLKEQVANLESRLAQIVKVMGV